VFGSGNGKINWPIVKELLWVWRLIVGLNCVGVGTDVTIGAETGTVAGKGNGASMGVAELVCWC
jgi:hypothetical protein